MSIVKIAMSAIGYSICFIKNDFKVIYDILVEVKDAYRRI
jgi:hypothetical protein